MWDVPVSVRCACWFNAWLAGDTSLDDARDAVVGDDAAHDVLGLEGAPTPLILSWGRLRSRGATSARPVLVEPGDLLGLAGPPSLNAAALDAGEAVLLEGADTALVPSAVGAGVFWQVHEARTHAYVPAVAEAERGLRESLARVAAAMDELDVAPWGDEVVDALASVRGERGPTLPAGYSPRAAALAGLAARCLAIGALASETPSGAVSSWEHGRRTEHLSDLARAARHALVAAASEPSRSR